MIEFDVNKLPATQNLILELLVARYRLGENDWPIPRTTAHTKALEVLAGYGLVEYQSGRVENTHTVWLTDEGRRQMMSSRYKPPVRTGRQRELFEECETAGWDPLKQNTFAEEIAHLHEELSEAFREWRMHKDFEIRVDLNGKPTGIPIEFADVLIGLYYNAELHKFDLDAATEQKHQYNLTRSYEDEGRRLHPLGEF